MSAGCGNLEGLGALQSALDVDSVPASRGRRDAVNELAVDEDVTVHNHLASLSRGAGEAGAQHEGVKTRLEDLDEVLTVRPLVRRASSKAIFSCFSRMPYWAQMRCFSRRRTA